MCNSYSSNVDILLLCNWRGIGGAQLNAVQLATAFNQRGYVTEICFLFDREGGIEFGDNSHYILASGKPRSLSDWGTFVRNCIEQVVSRSPRAIIAFQPAANIVGALAASRVPGCAMVASQQNPSDRQSIVAKRIDALLGSTAFYTSNVAVSETVRCSFAHYPKMYRRKLKVVHNATPELIDAPEDRASCRQRLGMRSDQLILGCLGRLHPQKNVRFAIELLPRLPEAALFLAGDGPLGPALRSKAESLGVLSRVEFLGPLHEADVTRFYRSLDALLFPSIYEGFGRVLTEAMSQGVPVIANDLPIVREVGGDAVMSLPLDTDAWVTAIRSIQDDATLKQRMSQLGRQRSTKFTLAAMVDGYLRATGLVEQPT